MEYVAIGSRAMLVVVFAVAAVGKLASAAAFRDFVLSLRDMRVVPPATARPLAILSVAVELAIIVLLCIPLRGTAIAGFVLAAGLLAAFAIAITLSLRRGNTEPCRCFGRSATPLGWHHVLRNGGLIVVAVLGGLLSLPDGSVTLVPSLVAVFCGMIVGGLVTVIDDIAFLFKPTAGSPARK